MVGRTDGRQRTADGGRTDGGRRADGWRMAGGGTADGGQMDGGWTDGRWHNHGNIFLFVASLGMAPAN